MMNRLGMAGTLLCGACRFVFVPITFTAALFLFSPTVAGAQVTTEIIFQSDFSTDPGWITDQPQNFYWDENEAALFARTINRPDPNYTPSRHYYTETNLNPRLSYEMTWDMKILSVQGGNTSGAAVFGLYGDRLYGFNPLSINFVGNDQDGTFSIRLVTLDGDSRFIFTELNPGYNNDSGEIRERSFSIGTWYTVTLTHNALTSQYQYEIKERASGEIVLVHVIQSDPDYPINPALQNLGISMHPEGTEVTNLGYGTRIEGSTEYLIDNVTLVQIIDNTYTEPSSVLFLPGIQSSRLYKDGLLGEDRLWEPNIDGDVAQLAMTEMGESINDIYTRDLVDEIFSAFDIYGSFMTYLDGLKAQGVISDWKPFAYDWRYSVYDIVHNGTQYEGEVRSPLEVVQTLARENNSKVTIIAHSNGGLLAKALVAALESEGKAYLIDKVILVASPQVGTPKAIGSILHGYDQEHAWGIIAEDETAREVIRNMPGAYGLVPSRAYFSVSSEPVIRFEGGAATGQFVNTYGHFIEDSETLIDFMVGQSDGRGVATTISEAGRANGNMLTDSQVLHRNVLDMWVAPSGIEVIEIVGVGLDTVKGFEYEEFIKRNCVSSGGPGGQVICVEEPYYEPVPQFSQYGDETVMALSAEGYRGSKQTYFVDLNEVEQDQTVPDVKHANITGLLQLQQFIGGLLQNSTIPLQFIYSARPTFTEEREVISVHSPVDLSLIDTNNNIVGKTDIDGYPTVVNDIPGSSYFEIGGAKYIIVPKNTNYTARIRGTGEEGSYTLRVGTISGEAEPVTVFSLSAATATPNLEAAFSKAIGIFSELTVDYDGDGTVDTTRELAPEPTISELFRALHTMVDGFTKLKVKDRNWLHNTLTKAESTGATKGYGSSAVLKIFAQIDTKLVQYVSGGKITLEEYNVFMGFVNEIKTR